MRPSCYLISTDYFSQDSTVYLWACLCVCVCVYECAFAMSTSGTLNSYYVDSLILSESEDLFAARYPGSGLQHARQTPVTEHAEFGSCTFQTKPSVFCSSWSPVPAQFPNGMPSMCHPHTHSQGTGESDGRCVQSWVLEPISGSLPFNGLPSNQHSGIKPENVGVRDDSTMLGSHTLLLPDFAKGSSPGLKDRFLNQISYSDPNEENMSVDKPDVNPSKYNISSSLQYIEILFTHNVLIHFYLTIYGFLGLRVLKESVIVFISELIKLIF